MPEVQRRIIVFADNLRLSNFATVITDPAGEHERIRSHSVEDPRTFDRPGLLADSGTFEAYAPISTDRERIIELYDDRTTIIWSPGSGTTLADEFRVSRVTLLDRGETQRPQPMISGGYSVAEDHHQSLGAIRYYNAALAAADDGPSFQITDGLEAGERIVVNLHPWARSGATPAELTGILFQSASDEVFTSPVTEFTFADVTDVLGGLALRGPAQQAVLDGDDATITGPWFRISVPTVTDGTWGLAVTVSHYTK